MGADTHRGQSCQIPGAGVTGGCEPPGVGVGNQMLILWKNKNVLNH